MCVFIAMSTWVAVWYGINMGIWKHAWSMDTNRYLIQDKQNGGRKRGREGGREGRGYLSPQGCSVATGGVEGTGWAQGSTSGYL